MDGDGGVRRVVRVQAAGDAAPRADDRRVDLDLEDGVLMQATPVVVANVLVLGAAAWASRRRMSARPDGPA